MHGQPLMTHLQSDSHNSARVTHCTPFLSCAGVQPHSADASAWPSNNLQVDLSSSKYANTRVSSQVCSPIVRTPVHGQPPAWRHTRGDVLLKLLSPAYAVEWILVDGLRPGPQL